MDNPLDAEYQTMVGMYRNNRYVLDKKTHNMRSYQRVVIFAHFGDNSILEHRNSGLVDGQQLLVEPSKNEVQKTFISAWTTNISVMFE